MITLCCKLQLLVSMDILRGYSCEVSIILLTLKECHTSTLEDNELLVNFVTKVLLTAIKVESKFHSEIKAIPRPKEQRCSNLKEILGKWNYSTSMQVDDCFLQPLYIVCSYLSCILF